MKFLSSIRFVFAVCLTLTVGVSCDKSPSPPIVSEEAGADAPRLGSRRDLEQARSALSVARRSRFGSGARIGAAEDAERDRPTAEELEEVRRLLEGFDPKTTSPEAAKAILIDARALETDAVLEVGQRLMDHPDPGVRAEALILADGATTASALPLLKRGFADSDVEIRRLALEMGMDVKDPAMLELVHAGLADADEDIQKLAWHIGMNQEGEARWALIREGMNSSSPETALAALAEADATPSRDMIPNMLPALEHPHEQVRELAHEILFLTFQQSFTTAAEAAAWWAKNQGQYDENLVFTEAP